MFALVVYAYLWAKQAEIALRMLSSPTLPEGIDREFLEAKLATARFYFAKILPGTTSLLASITAGADPVMAEGL